MMFWNSSDRTCRRRHSTQTCPDSSPNYERTTLPEVGGQMSTFLFLLALPVLLPFTVHAKLEEHLSFTNFRATLLLIVFGLVGRGVYPIPWFTRHCDGAICAAVEVKELSDYMYQLVLEGNGSSCTTFVLGATFNFLAGIFFWIGGIVELDYAQALCGLLMFAEATLCCMKATQRLEMACMILTIASIIFTLPYVGFSVLTGGAIDPAISSEALRYAQVVCKIAPYCVGLVLLSIAMLPERRLSPCSGPGIHGFLLGTAAFITVLEILGVCVVHAKGYAILYDNAFFLTLAAFYSVVNKYMHAAYPLRLGALGERDECSSDNTLGHGADSWVDLMSQEKS